MDKWILNRDEPPPTAHPISPYAVSYHAAVFWTHAWVSPHLQSWDDLCRFLRFWPRWPFERLDRSASTACGGLGYCLQASAPPTHQGVHARRIFNHPPAPRKDQPRGESFGGTDASEVLRRTRAHHSEKPGSTSRQTCRIQWSYDWSPTDESITAGKKANPGVASTQFRVEKVEKAIQISGSKNGPEEALDSEGFRVSEYMCFI
ncbi:uncharacterized protein DNG_02719 [Cephalotrichum gorgonifer]|uniref:Uncharacterized protein n=1 Tax=Cephalotrichum gorgonifer TaxID=2041049 RepID=A0AAE8MV22_9PEZI|nr:uncharacterized protein DNG_02719 [Cephalotrichum gorgonifer]